MKKYHRHVGKVKILTKNEINESFEKFQFDKNAKPHCKALQESIVSYLFDMRN